MSSSRINFSDTLRARKFFMSDQLVERFALDILHDNELRAELLGEFVNRDDVGMIQGGGGFGFLDETAFSLRISDLVRGQYFHRNHSIETNVNR